jgi:hypothetical protein
VNDLPSYLSNTSDPVNVNGKEYIVLCMQMILYYCLNLPKVYKKNLIYLIHTVKTGVSLYTVKTGVSLSTQVKLKFLFSIRQADLLNIVLGMEMKILNVYQIVNI